MLFGMVLMQLGLSREFESYQGEVWQLDGSWLQIFGRFVDESTDFIEKHQWCFLSGSDAFWRSSQWKLPIGGSCLNASNDCRIEERCRLNGRNHARRTLKNHIIDGLDRGWWSFIQGITALRCFKHMFGQGWVVWGLFWLTWVYPTQKHPSDSQGFDSRGLAICLKPNGFDPMKSSTRIFLRVQFSGPHPHLSISINPSIFPWFMGFAMLPSQQHWRSQVPKILTPQDPKNASIFVGNPLLLNLEQQPSQEHLFHPFSPNHQRSIVLLQSVPIPINPSLKHVAEQNIHFSKCNPRFLT